MPGMESPSCRVGLSDPSLEPPEVCVWVIPHPVMFPVRINHHWLRTSFLRSSVLSDEAQPTNSLLSA